MTASLSDVYATLKDRFLGSSPRRKAMDPERIQRWMLRRWMSTLRPPTRMGSTDR